MKLILKRNLTVLTLLVVFFALATEKGLCQSNDMVGIKIGLNSSRFGAPFQDFPEPTSSFGFGYHAGINYFGSISKRVGYEGNFLYSHRRVTYDRFFTLGEPNGEARYHYISSPWGLRIKTIETIDFCIGLQFATLISAVKDGIELMDTPVLYPIEIGAYTGFNLRPTSRIAFSLRYYHGFTSSIRASKYLSQDLINQTIQVSTIFSISDF